MSTNSAAAAASPRLLLPGGNFIGGDWKRPANGQELAVIEPATGEEIARIPASSESDVDLAVSTAHASARGWRDASPSQRGRILWRLAALIREHEEDLAYTETRDSGKPIAESREDILATADTFEYYAGLATKIRGETLPLPGNQLGMVLREPAGVVGAITPWNFPILMAAWKVAPALACGNAVVLKPSSLASLSCLALARLAIEAGVPAGVLNVITGTGSEAGVALAGHRGLDVLAFTGSTSTGQEVMAARARHVRPVQVELGGKSPNVVFGDADIERAVAGAAFAIFYAQGENCNAGSRLIVERSIHDEFVDRLVAATEKIRVLPPTDERSQMGALISRGQLDRVKQYVEIGRAEGARVATGGTGFDAGPLSRGYFYRPTILTNVGRDHRVFQEEIFGPVLTVTAFDTDDEAIELANGTEFGLAAGVWTADHARALRCAQELVSGYVWVNTFNTTPIEAPFGGVKSSGFGRDCSTQAIELYTTWKTVAFATAPFEGWYQE